LKAINCSWTVKSLSWIQRESAVACDLQYSHIWGVCLSRKTVTRSCREDQSWLFHHSSSFISSVRQVSSLAGVSLRSMF